MILRSNPKYFLASFHHGQSLVSLLLHKTLESLVGCLYSMSKVGDVILELVAATWDVKIPEISESVVPLKPFWEDMGSGDSIRTPPMRFFCFFSGQ